LFTDIAVIEVKGGDGGNGAVSFHRDKSTAFGGPDGGNGGRGGSVIFVADSNLSTLSDFKYKIKYFAKDGQNGGPSKCSGKSAEDLIVRLPPGTLIIDNVSGELLCDLDLSEPFVAASGGKGGAGNMNFATPVRRAPHYAKPGDLGESFQIRLELKLIADVGLIGFPNVGKSTFISTVSRAAPKIANYHFTTLAPMLGVAEQNNKSFVIADIPGIIEGASRGAGLGYQFLHHIQRCRILIHMVDVSGSENRDPIKDFELINKELKNFSKDLANYPMIAAANKIDIATPEQILRFKKYIENKNLDFFPISAATNFGLKEILNFITEKLEKLPPILKFLPNKKFISDKNKRKFNISKKNDAYVINSVWLEKILETVNLEYNDSLKYFQNVLEKNEINKALKNAGAVNGDTVKIGYHEFNFMID
jgi:GTP-binding protein